MTRLLFVLCVTFSLYSAEGFRNWYPKLTLNEKIDGDCGDPLFLTQYIESGKIEEGRRLARVPITEDLNITSYAGFFTVNKTYNSNHFFWYFPAMSKPKPADVVLWLQGGPGASSLYGLFSENGPLKVEDDKLKKRDIHWALNYHLIYIDNPVGTGFSFTDEDAGYCTDQTQIGEQLYSSIVQFFQLFPDLQANKFFVTGESYAGKYVPALAYTIHKNNPTADLKINLKGLAIGDGWCDPEHQLGYGEYLNQIGLIDWNDKKRFDKAEEVIKKAIQEKDWNKAVEANICMDLYLDITGLENVYNYILPFDNDDFGPFVTSSVARKAIHVGKLPFNNGSKVYDNLRLDMMKSVAPIISELLDHYRILMYSGQLDVIVAYPLTTNFLRHLNFTDSHTYEKADRLTWWVEHDVAGFVKKANNLVEVFVRSAGHMVPKDQPKWASDMLYKFTNDFPYADI